MIFIHGGIYEFYGGHRKTPVFRPPTELALLTNKNPSYYRCVQKHSLWGFSAHASQLHEGVQR
jgi:hypothetical protein